MVELLDVDLVYMIIMGVIDHRRVDSTQNEIPKF